MPLFAKFGEWVLQATVKEIVAIALGSAAVTASVNWAVQNAWDLSVPALVALWIGTMFLSFLVLVRVVSRFPSFIGEPSVTTAQIPAIPESWSAWYKQPLTVVHHKTFENQDVPLDGFKYEHCKFKNVTFTITGAAPFGLVKPEMAGEIRIDCLHPVYKAVQALYEYVVSNFPGEFKGGIKDDYGNVTWTHELKYDPDLDLNKKRS